MMDDDGAQKSKMLFDDDSDNEGPAKEEKKSLKINKKFAADYKIRKQQEEYQRVLHFEGPDALRGDDDESSSDSSSEDEDGEFLTPAVDVEIFKTINALRNKDKKIYDPNTKFFTAAEQAADDSDSDEDGKGDEKARRKKKTKPKRYTDVVREQALEKMNEDGHDEGDNSDDGGRTRDDFDSNRTSRFAYDEQQHDLRKAFLDSTAAADNSDNSDDSGDDNFMAVRKVKDAAEDQETQKELLEEMQKLEKSAADDSEDAKLVDPKGEVKDGDKFLMNFFKNKAWHEQNEEDEESSDDDDQQVPLKPPRHGHESDEDSLEKLDQTDNFEAEYNFRFEQAAAGGDATPSGADFSVIGYARGQTVNTLRRKDDSRREKRLARQERKATERKAKEEQLKRLKNAKKQELDDKLKQVKAVLGNVDGAESAPVDEATIMKLMEGDFDPDKFEEIMKDIYSDDFYQEEDAEWKNDKDVRDALTRDEDGALLVGQDDADGGLYDNVEEAEYAEGADEGYDENAEEEDWPEEEYYDEGADEAPPESQLEKKLKEKMMDELYKLDYEDIIAGMPTRFKYRQVEKNSYGLSAQEILFSRDATLKQFVSLKKMAPYNEQGEFQTDARRRRRFREMLKKDLQEQAEAEEQETEQKPKAESTEDAAGDDAAVEGETKKKKRRRLKKNKRMEETEEVSAVEDKEPAVDDKEATGMEEEQPKASKKRRRKKKKAAQDDAPEESEKAVAVEIESAATKEKKRKKKRKQKEKKAEAAASIEGVPESRLASYGL